MSVETVKIRNSKSNSLLSLIKETQESGVKEAKAFKWAELKNLNFILREVKSAFPNVIKSLLY